MLLPVQYRNQLFCYFQVVVAPSFNCSFYSHKVNFDDCTISMRVKGGTLHDRITAHYVNDGYSGTTFNRPAFQEMIVHIKAGKN